MELSQRKKKVLRSVVDLYIRTAEPVGSKAVAELPDMNYSSATIRNEMADLTALGYLEQPHTSAGRVPSAAGYRMYVDELMADYRLSIDETRSINTAIEEKMQRVDKLVEKVAKLVSQATDLPAISAAARPGGAFPHPQLRPIRPAKISEILPTPTESSPAPAMASSTVGAVGSREKSWRLAVRV